MRFMMLMIPKGYEKSGPGVLPSVEAVKAMERYNESLQQAGVLLALDGLHPPAAGVRISRSGGKVKVTDGPFTEAKEAIGGYWLIQVKSKAEAIEWASRCHAFQPPAPDGEAVVELRQVQELSDWPAELQAALGKSSVPQHQAPLKSP